MNDRIKIMRRLSTILRQIKNTQKQKKTQTATLFPTQTRDRKNTGKSTKHQDWNQLAIKLCRKHWWKLWKSTKNLLNSCLISDPRVDFPEPTAISKSCPRPHKNSRALRLRLYSPSTLRFESFLWSWWSSSVHKSHLRRGGRTWYQDWNWNCAGLNILEEIELHNGPHFIPKSPANIAKITLPYQYFFNPVHK